MDYKRFYAQLFNPLEAKLGPIDRNTICAIMGFDGGGPLSFCTFGVDSDLPIITYVSCELAVREEQVPSNAGRYELLCSCDDEEWVRSILSELGQMSLHSVFGHGHTVDIGPWVEPDAPIQGVWLELEYTIPIDGEKFSVYRVIGITRQEMEYTFSQGSEAMLAALKVAGVYPHTVVRRPSSV